MIVKVNIAKLQEILDLTNRFVSKHATLPVLENVYLKGNIDTLLFRATDMEKFIEIEIPAEIESEGAITVNAKTFAEIIRMLEEEDVQLIADESKDLLKIKTTNDDFFIKGISANEFIAVPDFAEINSIELDIDNIIKGISKVESAIIEKNLSPLLTGMVIKLAHEDNQKKLFFAGTDNFRLSEYKINYGGEFEDFNMIVPKLNIIEIKKVCEYAQINGGNTIRMFLTENFVIFKIALENLKITATSLLIQGNYPNYQDEKIMPTKYNTKTILDKTVLDKAIKKISILTRDNNSFLEVCIENNQIIINSGDTDKGNAKTIIPGNIEGNDIKFAISGKFINDFLKSINSNNIVMHTLGAGQPIVFKDLSDDNYTYVIRPIM